MGFEYPKQNIGWHSPGDGSVEEDVFQKALKIIGQMRRKPMIKNRLFTSSKDNLDNP